MLLSPRLLLTVSFLVTALPTTAQISLRPVTQLNGSFFRFTSAADEDLFAVTYGAFFFADAIYVRVADGRGLFGPEIRLNPASPTIGALSYNTSVQVVDSSIFVMWSESLNPSFLTEPYIACSTDRGATFSPPRALDKGLPFGTGAVQEMAMVAAPDDSGGAHHVHVLMRTSPDRRNGDLFLVSSLDGGQTFSAAVPVSTADALGADVDEIALAADGDAVHVLWVDDRNDLAGGANDLFFRRSLDGGTTWAETEQQLNSSTGDFGQRTPLVAADAGEIAVLWQQGIVGFAEIRGTHSADRGATFATDSTVGGYDPTSHFAFPIDMHAQDGSLFLAFQDTRLGSLNMWLTCSDDRGASWNPDVLLPRAASGGSAPHLAGDGDVLGITFDAFGAGATAFSADRGQTWSPATLLGTTGVSRHLPRMEYDPVYDNFVCLWTEAPGGGDSELYATGYRPQRLIPRGFTGGATTISFRLDGFSGPDRHALVLGAFTPGPAALPVDGRLLGLAPDPLFALSAGLAGGALGSGLSPAGSGRTPDIPITLPEGNSLYWVGLSYGGNALFGQITDVVRTNF